MYSSYVRTILQPTCYCTVIDQTVMETRAQNIFRAEAPQCMHIILRVHDS